MEKVICFTSAIKEPFVYPTEIKMSDELEEALDDGFTIKSINQEVVLGKTTVEEDRSNKNIETNEYFIVMTFALEKKQD